MSHEEDDDAFLYGEEEETTVLNKKQKVEGTKTEENVANDVNDSTQQSNEEENEVDDAEEEEDDDDEEEDDDSDIEFIIGSEEKTDSNAQDASATTSITAPAVASETLDEVNDIETANTVNQTTDATIVRVPDIDINKVGEYDGKPITSINAQDLKEKPWRQPGADTSEYFNYGFDEFTWTAYCTKQDDVRANFNPQKILMSLMPMGIPPPMMMGLPGALPGGLPNFPIPPGSIPPPNQNILPQDNSNSTPQPQEHLTQQQTPLDLPQIPQPRFPTAPASAFNGTNPPKGPSGSGTDRERERDVRDRSEFERERNGNFKNDYRDRDRRPRYNRGRR